MSTDLKKQVHQTLNSLGLNHFEIIALQQPLSFKHYESWLNNGFHGDMNYMSESDQVRKNPKENFKPAKSIIVFRQNYFPHPENEGNKLNSLKVAHYAKGKDYHYWFRSQLNLFIDSLQKQFPDETFFAYTDSVPLLERDHAYQAGLGWVGKNTCLIDRKSGSLFFIGEILTSLDCSNEVTPSPDFCGTCTACIDACPTQAFEEPRVLNANKCIAYWNIESKTSPPIEIREAMGDWFFGCDICQTVCPWNIKLHKLNPQFIPQESSKESLEEELKMILESSNKKLLRFFAETPLTRAGGRGLKRNALIVIGNTQLTNLRPQVESYLKDQHLGELAQWTLDKLS